MTDKEPVPYHFTDAELKDLWLKELAKKDEKIKELESKITNEYANVSRIKEWFDDKERKPAMTYFTEGPERQIAYLIEGIEAKIKGFGRDEI